MSADEMNRVLAWILLLQPQLGLGYPNLTGDVASHKNWNLIHYDQCGMANSDRIIGGVNASIGSYPWIARIGYLKHGEVDKEPTFRCGASVIAPYYIITAAHCVSNLTNSYVSRIRLGEHNTETNPDCDQSFCNDPYQDFLPVEIVAHEMYDKPKLRNDIAVIRLDRMINYTEYIRPICLMRRKLLAKNFTGMTAEVAGWGVYDINEPQMSPLLQTVKLPLVSQERCIKGYKKAIPIGPTQMCVGGRVGKDSCGGDSGGPLMKVEHEDGEVPGPRYYLIGLVSFGAKLCGESNLPGVYTKLADYMTWVLDHIRP